MRTFSYIVLLVTGLLAASCTGNKVYDKYNHTPVAGWEKNDTLSFDIPRVKTGGLYNAELGLRINNSYPFMGLTLIVTRTIYPKMVVHTDTLNCHLIDKNGNTNGQGISYYQYDFPVGYLQLQKGDSLHVTVRHDMKREILPGISDIGLQLSKK